MGASDYLKDEDSSESSSTYIEFHSDEEKQREAYMMCSRGGDFRTKLEDMSDFFGELIPKVGKYLFDSDPIPVMEWLEIDEEDIEAYREEVLEAEDSE